MILNYVIATTLKVELSFVVIVIISRGIYFKNWCFGVEFFFILLNFDKHDKTKSLAKIFLQILYSRGSVFEAFKLLFPIYRFFQNSA